MPRKKKEKKSGRPRGRPHGSNTAIIDPEQLTRLAMLHCTYEELAFVYDCSTKTLQTKYRDQIDKARANAKVTLRRKLWEEALGGNTRILELLASNLLGLKHGAEGGTGFQEPPDLIAVFIDPDNSKFEGGGNQPPIDVQAEGGNLQITESAVGEVVEAAVGGGD